jgi:Carboxypeptidase regulatory-like domain
VSGDRQVARALNNHRKHMCHLIRRVGLNRRWHFRSPLKNLLLSLAICAPMAISLSVQSQSTSSLPETDHASSVPDAPVPPTTGNIRSTVLDKDGAAIPNAKIVITEGSFHLESQSGNDGSFALQDVPAGSFELSVSATGFATQLQSGILQPGEDRVLPPVQLVVATTVEVNVTQTREEIAEDQIHVEEQQRLLGVLPNYYVTYVPNAAPLNTRQKFELGWKFVLNPFSFGISGAIAGIEQANNSFSGYGQGAQGYAKRFGATYADFVSGTFFGNVIFPALLKQDPRYFYKGTGSKKSRFLYAIANAVICKGDNGHWQPNYSSVLGSLAAGGLSNLYYPASNRNGVGLTFENTLIGIGGSAAAGVVQEFFSKRITPHARDQQAAQ